ncbi:nucleoside-diphosphate-sugar epimerase [Acetobacter sp. CAG:977]|nr:nucleoside-diphosphate-sugar epimerase [Acetobacter sp. CAG:977]
MFVITGGAGFIGSNVAAQIEAREMGEVAVIDRLRNGDKWRNISKRFLRNIVFPEDTFDFLNERAAKIEAVLHFGAISSPMENDVDTIVKNNIQLTWSLWKWCTEHEVPFIYASSAAVYGDGSLGFADDLSTEALAKLRPLSPFAWSKLFMDRKVAEAVEDDKMTPPQWVGLRFFNLYGPNEYHKGHHQSVIPQIYTQAKNGKLFPLFKSENPEYKDGDQMRDFMWIDDCVDIVLWFLTHRETSGLFNAGTGLARTYADVLRAVYAALEEDPEMDFIDLPDALKNKYQYFTQADISKLRAAGYDKPFTTLEDGVAKYVKDFLSSADPYR